MISAIILAAGESKRMTLGNKLLLRKNNVPLIKITFENIKASKVDNISIVLGKNIESVKNIISDKNVKFLKNNDYQNGISTSIKKGIENLNPASRGVLICLGDMPLIKTDTYNEIIDAFYKSNNQSIIPYFKKKRGNPILFSQLHFKELISITGDNGAKYFINEKKNEFLSISVSDEGILFDIDNKKQFKSFIKK
tara:strand:+ start:518 stop:1102 length:585 start_codon:yes stop_codon:yes gene_type:complete